MTERELRAIGYQALARNYAVAARWMLEAGDHERCIEYQRMAAIHHRMAAEVMS